MYVAHLIKSKDVAEHRLRKDMGLSSEEASHLIGSVLR
jgi:hypothetical protein